MGFHREVNRQLIWLNCGQVCARKSCIVKPGKRAGSDRARPGQDSCHRPGHVSLSPDIEEERTSKLAEPSATQMEDSQRDIERAIIY